MQPHMPAKRTGTAISLCAFLWAVLFFTMMMIGGLLQTGIESDAMQYTEYTGSSCNGSVVLALDFGKGSGCMQLAIKGSQNPLFITGSCDSSVQGASVSVCQDAVCSVGCVTMTNGIYENCTTGGIAYGGASTFVGCTDRQQSLRNGVGVFVGFAAALFSLLAALLMADVHQIIYAYVLEKYFPQVASVHPQGYNHAQSDAAYASLDQ